MIVAIFENHNTMLLLPEVLIEDQPRNYVVAGVIFVTIVT
jgi:hypothetical protein